MYAKTKSVKIRGYKVSESLLLKKNQLWVSDNEDLQLEVFKEIHNQPAISHPGVERILNMAHRHYYWLHIHDIIEQYIQNCHVCKRAKTAHNTYNRLFQPLPVSEKLWVNMTIDFVTSLLKCYAYGQIYDAIFIVINRLLKKRHYILYTKENKKTFTETTAELFM